METTVAMVTEPVYYLAVAGSPTIEIPHEELRSLLSQIETDLHRSKVYRSALASLQKLLGESPAAKTLIKAVGREAIRLVFQTLAKQTDVPVQTQEASTTPTDVSIGQVSDREASAGQSLTSDREEEASAGQSLTSKTSLRPVPEAGASTYMKSTPGIDNTSEKLLGFTKRTKKPTKAEIAAQTLRQEREEYLRRLGEEIKQARYSQSLSLHHLQERSFVPRHHIEALENGRIEVLPEDVYLRGFIQRLGNALRLNGAEMSYSLPAPDPVRTVLPSWYHPKPAGFHLSPMHLYLGYTALVEGAVGGLALLSQQSTIGETRHPVGKPSQPSVSPPSQRAERIAKPGLSVGATWRVASTSVAIGPDIAPPEAFAF
jgi:hypothetical protein